LNQTGTKTVICTRAELERLCEVKKSGKCPRFECAVLVDGVIAEAARMAEDANLKILSFAKVEAVGAQTIATTGHTHRPPSGKDIFTFCYTSGTTGTPKGALLTHENLVSAIAGAKDIFPLTINDRHLSYLPLPHIVSLWNKYSLILLWCLVLKNCFHLLCPFVVCFDSLSVVSWLKSTLAAVQLRFIEVIPSFLLKICKHVARRHCLPLLVC
jgi:long-subunit acyl-CoA synthetase (AMP-forming)